MLTKNAAVTNDRGMELEQAVLERYSAASKTVQPSLCCAVSYDRKFLDVLPAEIIERDYGCGDPSQHVQQGETVLDLGSGGGKICFIASQIVGPRGRVIGIDMNDEMLGLSRKYVREIGERIGWHNVEFHKGRIQDLALQLERFDDYLREHPVCSAADWFDRQRWADEQRRTSPMIPSETIDVVVSNCVLNLVSWSDRFAMFGELHRVLRAGGRAVISDIVSDKKVPVELQNDPALWSGCISGAFQEQDFIATFQRAGFCAIEILNRQQDPWQVVQGIEFRSITVRAFKPGSDGLPQLPIKCC
jgi:arsenite methyltransferase